jgi:Protein of unknown function (DUF2809)
LNIRQKLTRYRLSLLLSAGAAVILGYLVRFHGPGPEWLNDGLGSVAYEMFWIVLVLFCFPKASPLKVSIGVFAITCGLEVLQLWKPPFLETLRATLPGRLVLGNTFSWTDFPAYMIGSGLGYGWSEMLRRLFKK